MILKLKQIILRMLAVPLCILLFSGFTSVNPNEFHKSSISIEKTSDGSELLNISYNGQSAIVTLPILEVNHPQEIKSSLPYPLFVTRLSNATLVKIDGKDFSLPNPKASLSARIQKKLPVRRQVNKAIYISGQKMNADQMRIIQEAFKSIGIEQPIRFSDHNISLLHAEEVQIFTKEVLLPEERKENKNTRILIETKIEERR